MRPLLALCLAMAACSSSGTTAADSTCKSGVKWTGGDQESPEMHPGGDCIACHMPRIAQTIADVNVRSHTFRFITPSMSDQFKMPNPCLACHTDHDTAWVRSTMAGWSTVSSWRTD